MKMAKKKIIKKSASKKKSNSVSKKSKLSEDAKTYAFLATFLSIIGFLIALLTKKEDKYVMFYAKQSLIVFIVFLAGALIMIVPILGWILGPIINLIGLVLWIISWIYSLSGEMKEVPLVGQYHDRFDL